MDNKKEKIRIKCTPLYHNHVLDCEYDVVVQVGGRFSGKSHNEQIRLVKNMITKKDYKLLVIEDLETGMSEGFHSGLYARIRDFRHEAAYTQESKVAHIKNKLNNNTVIFRGYSSEQQKLNVKNLSEVTEILVEEGEWMRFDDFISLYQQLRGGTKKDRKLTILLNPVNPDCFVNQHLIETTPDKVYKYFEGTKRPKVFEKSITTTFEIDSKEITKTIKILVVLSTHFDNNFLTLEQRASIEQYKVTDPEKYLQLGEARFIKSTDTYFREFKREIHCVTPFSIPDTWKKYVSMDYGLDMFAVLWYAVDYYNNVYVYKYIHQSDLIISKAALEFKRVNGTDNYGVIYAPPDLWNRRQETGKSAVDIFRENGINLVKSRNDRVNGWYSVKEWLNVYQSLDAQTGEMKETAKLRIFDNVEPLIKNIPKAMKDEHNQNDISNEPHEITHILDALRYFLCMRNNPPKRSQKVKDEFGLNKARERKTNKITNDYINY